MIDGSDDKLDVRWWGARLAFLVCAILIALGCALGFRLAQKASFTNRPDKPPPHHQLYVLIDPQEAFDRSFLLGVKLARAGLDAEESPETVQLVVLQIDTTDGSDTRLSEELQRNIPATERAFILGPNTSLQTETLIRALELHGEVGWRFILGDATLAVEIENDSFTIPGSTTDETAEFDAWILDALAFTAVDNRLEAQRLLDAAGGDNVTILVGSEENPSAFIRQLKWFLEAACTTCDTAVYDDPAEVKTLLAARDSTVVIPLTDRSGAHPVIRPLAELGRRVIAPDSWNVEGVRGRAKEQGFDVAALVEDCDLRGAFHDFDRRFAHADLLPSDQVLRADDIDIVAVARGYDVFLTWYAIMSGEESAVGADGVEHELATNPEKVPGRWEIWADADVQVGPPKQVSPCKKRHR